MAITSVLGHLTNMDFPDEYNNWRNVDPSDLFQAPINKDVVESVS